MPERKYSCWYSGGVAEIEELSMEELSGDTGKPVPVALLAAG